jgi:MFS family permease
MTYFGELRTNWRALLASAIGMGAGMSINMYVTSIFAPYLIADFGWSKSQFALVGTTTLVMLFCVPFIGRLTDRFGVRRMATVGVIAMPVSFLAFSFYEGDILGFIGIYALQLIFGTTTSATVYSRLVAERFDSARGIALALVACGPAVVGALGSPALNAFIETHGWRAGYQALAVYAAVAGLLALSLIPPLSKSEARAVQAQRPARRDYALILRNPAFAIIMIGTFLCSVPMALHNQQMKMMLLDNGATSAGAAMMMSSYAIGVIAGRLLCGIALDRLPAHLVAAISMGLPSAGLLLIASPFDSFWVLASGVMLMGLSLGAEGDVLAFLVMRYFGVQVYSGVLGLTVAAVGIASAIGSVVLSATLAATGTFALFVLSCGIGVFFGSALFLLLGRPTLARVAEQLANDHQASEPPQSLRSAAAARA